jgi:hypothetical protein
LLNILIALYNSAYEDIYENADDEFLALFAQKTMQFIRAPDENVYVPPFNLIEIVIAAMFEWWMNKKQYERLNDGVMGFIYSPLLVFAAWTETRTARDIKQNRRRGDEDDDTIEEWEQMLHELDFEADGWGKKVDGVKSNVEEEPAVLEVRKLRAELEALKALVLDFGKTVGSLSEKDAEMGKEKGKKKANKLIDVGEAEGAPGESSESSSERDAD